MDDEIFVQEANAQNLADFEVWRATVDNKEYYMATRDPMNRNYASWFCNVMSRKNMRYKNCECLGDLVKAGIGASLLGQYVPEPLEAHHKGCPQNVEEN